jgi:hypothetical protein
MGLKASEMEIQPPLFFNLTEVGSIEELLLEFPPRAFASPFRSTVPLVSLVKDDWPILGLIADSVGMRPSGIHFEFQVAPPGVDGNPSQTDAMLLSDQCAIAVEAKWTEPRYETVVDRVRSRVARLAARDKTKGEEQHRASQIASTHGCSSLVRRLVCGWEQVMLIRWCTRCFIARPPHVPWTGRSASSTCISNRRLQRARHPRAGTSVISRNSIRCSVHRSASRSISLRLR